MNEQWVKCLDFPNYEVSNTGKVRRAKNGREIKFGISFNGYYVVRIWYNGKKYTPKVSRLVWTSFNNCGCRMVIDHIDRNKLNNNLSNLRCVTYQENWANRGIYQKNVYNLNREKKIDIIIKLRTGSTLKEVSEQYGIPRNYLSTVLKRGSWDKLLDDTRRI